MADSAQETEETGADMQLPTDEVEVRRMAFGMALAHRQAFKRHCGMDELVREASRIADFMLTGATRG